MNVERSREPWRVDESLPSVPVDWRAILQDGEQSFLTDNQLSAFMDPGAPGCQKVHFRPLPFTHRFKDNRWSFPEIMSHDSLISAGPSLDFTPERTALAFLPCLLTKRMTAGGREITERSAIGGDVLACTWDMEGVDSVTLSFSLPYLPASCTRTDSGLVLSVRDQAFAALCLSGADTEMTETAAPWACAIRMRPTGGTVCLGLACGYAREEAARAAQAAAADPGSVFAAAAHAWDQWFTRVVPRFSCSDRRLERLYYYQAYVTRTAVYDIPFEPYTHLYTCPWKTGAVWQWSWNTPMDSMAERWLNDKEIGAGGNLLMLDNGGAVHIGASLRPLRKVTELRGHNAHMRAVGACRARMPEDADWTALTTLPHTTPNGMLGAYAHALSTGDPAYMRRILELMAEAEAQFSLHALPNGLCTCSFVDEFDYSLRLKPFIRGFSKGDPEMMMKMDTPFIAPDYNCGLYALRERIIAAARTTGDSTVDIAVMEAQNRVLKDAVNAHLWDEATGFYYDADPRTMERSTVKCIAGFAALYSGVASVSQAARLVGHLTDPREFGTPFPFPSVSMDTPDADPSLITYGGDSQLTSGIWFTVEGLVRYGYRDLAARTLLKVIEMVTRDGPSSSYSYNALTGARNMEKHTLCAQSVILTDLICKYVIGIVPLPDGAFGVDPLALEASGLSQLSFGPYRYCGRSLRVDYSRGGGYRLTAE